LFEDLFESDDIFHVADGEYLVWFLEDFVQLLLAAGVERRMPIVRRVLALIDRYEALYVENERLYYDTLDSERSCLRWWYDKLSEKNLQTIRAVAPLYAADYSDRVFHDRQLCEYIARLLLVIGFNGNDDLDGPPKKWVKRRDIPAWARSAVIARDRGCCALCSTSISFELLEDAHIDHIVPLAKGGCNDLLNLQLLCSNCNRNKSTQDVPVRSSVPAYIARRLLRSIG
jgi:hypothetical protein